MAYVERLIGKEEKLVGIGRLHWIYVARGAMWLLSMVFAGWALSFLLGQGLINMAPYFETMSAERSLLIANMLVNLQSYSLIFFMAVGTFFFMLYLVKYMVTEVALTSRRVIHKEGFIFVNVRDIDLEEVRGETLDLGWFGRMLNYGYLLLDCRFLGDVRLPALAKAEAFLKALHYYRSHTQDAVSVVLGKGNPVPLEVRNPEDTGDERGVQFKQESEPAKPEVPTPEKTPEQPPAQPAQPEQPKPEVTPQPQQPVQPEIVPQQPEIPQPQQPEIQPDPGPQKPEIQIPPQATQAQAPDQPQQPEVPQPQQPEVQPDPVPQKPAIQTPPQAQAIDPQAVAQIVAQVVPGIVQEMVEKGIVAKDPAGAERPSQDTDDDLLAAFDGAAFKTEARSVQEVAKKSSVH